MKTAPLVLVTVMALAASVIAMGAKCPPEGGDGNGLSVMLEVPWTTLLGGERLTYRFILENASDEAVPVAIPFADKGLGEPTGGQPFIEAKWKNGGLPFPDWNSDMPKLRVDNAVWPPKGIFGDEMQSWAELLPGQTIAWDQNRLPCLYFGIHAYETLEALQAHWLVGPNRWISSMPVPVKVLIIPRSAWQQAFEARWSSYGLGRNQRSGTAYTIPIDGRLLLFWNDVRVAEVGPNDRFEHQIDKDGTNMEITIIGPAGSRKVYYHLRHGLTRDTPWPIGPVSLFYPQPEPIPPAELATLRNKSTGSGIPRNGSPSATAQGRPAVKIDIIEPFEFTFTSESPVMFVRISNTGTAPMGYAFGANSDLQFENDPALATGHSELAPWPRRFAYVRNKAKPNSGRSFKVGESIVLSQSDFCDLDFSMNQDEYRRIRPHFRVETGTWVAGDWYERKVMQTPDLTTAKSLYDYKLGADGPPHSVIVLPINGETWLCSCRLPSSYKNLPGASGSIDTRLCRIPDGKMPPSIVHDMGAQRLTIRFGGGEEDVVINTRTGMPVSGSERTVPHLHLWMKLSGRPFRGAYQEMLDGKVPQMVVAAPSATPGTSPTANEPQIPARDQAAVRRTWIVIGAALILALAAFIAFRSGRGGQHPH